MDKYLCTSFSYQITEYVIWKRHFDDREALRRINGSFGHILHMEDGREEATVCLCFVDQAAHDRFFEAVALDVTLVDHTGGERLQESVSAENLVWLDQVEAIAYDGSELDTGETAAHEPASVPLGLQLVEA